MIYFDTINRSVSNTLDNYTFEIIKLYPSDINDRYYSRGYTSNTFKCINILKNLFYSLFDLKYSIVIKERLISLNSNKLGLNLIIIDNLSILNEILEFCKENLDELNLIFSLNSYNQEYLEIKIPEYTEIPKKFLKYDYTLPETRENFIQINNNKVKSKETLNILFSQFFKDFV